MSQDSSDSDGRKSLSRSGEHIFHMSMSASPQQPQQSPTQQPGTAQRVPHQPTSLPSPSPQQPQQRQLQPETAVQVRQPTPSPSPSPSDYHTPETSSFCRSYLQKPTVGQLATVQRGGQTSPDLRLLTLPESLPSPAARPAPGAVITKTRKPGTQGLATVKAFQQVEDQKVVQRSAAAKVYWERIKKQPVDLKAGLAPGNIDQNDIDILAKKTNNSWTVTNYLAKGTYGFVFEVVVGRNELGLKPGGSYAVKIVKKVIENEMAINQILMQAEKHPNLLSCWSIFTKSFYHMTNIEKRYYFIMDLTELDHLQKVIKWATPPGYGFSDDEAKWLSAGLVKAVYYLKQLGIAHCDIKPANIMIFENPDRRVDATSALRFIPKLCDFSHSMEKSLEDDLCYISGKRCTLCYTSPEGYDTKGEGYDGFTLDVYSVACCIYFIKKHQKCFETNPVYNQNPYREASIRYVMRQMTDDNVRQLIRQEIQDPMLAQLLLEALAWDFRKRITIERMIEHPWLRMFAEM